MSVLTGGKMDFNAFLDWSVRVRRDRPEVTPLCEMRIARAFASIRPGVEAPSGIKAVHRCDLARDWCQLRGLPVSLSKRALVCRGVREALKLLFARFARSGETVAIPRDVYPVYWTIAANTGVRAVGVETFPACDLKEAFAVATNCRATHLLLPFPLKLQGRGWSDIDIAGARAWLADGDDRRLLLDGVYSFGLRLGDDVRALIATDQVIYLDSLSKGWLHERVFGTAIVPERDLEHYAPAFRSERAEVGALQTAHALMRTSPGFPARLTSEIDRLRTALATQLEGSGLKTSSATNGYLLAVEGEAEALLRQHDILTIPASVFGSDAPGWSVASALPADAAP